MPAVACATCGAEESSGIIPGSNIKEYRNIEDGLNIE
jgi:hypothetical protein